MPILCPLMLCCLLSSYTMVFWSNGFLFFWFIWCNIRLFGFIFIRSFGFDLWTQVDERVYTDHLNVTILCNAYQNAKKYWAVVSLQTGIVSFIQKRIIQKELSTISHVIKYFSEVLFKKYVSKIYPTYSMSLYFGVIACCV